MFFGGQGRSRAARRGVVLILILGMLALMALIGVTFATFAGQSLVGSRNFKESVNFPSSDQVMDFALAQLINDTNNPASALRGHSLLRDMYGNDSLMTGGSAAFGCLLSRLPDGSLLQLFNPTFYNGGPVPPDRPFNYSGFPQYTTNIPVYSMNPALYNVDFTHWMLRVPAFNGNIEQTFEVLEDDRTTAVHVLTLSRPDPSDQSGTGNPVTKIYGNPVDTTNGTRPDAQYVNGDSDTTKPGTRKGFVTMNQPPVPTTTQTLSGFVLDGRFMRAFNGPGLSQVNNAGLPDATFGGAGQPHNSAAFANFRTNGNLIRFPFVTFTPAQLGTPTFGEPNSIGMDEDYDACDLENWYLALQSADGQVMIPSFHRPGILTQADWRNQVLPTNSAAANFQAIMSMSKILRPRKVDMGGSGSLFPDDPVPDRNVPGPTAPPNPNLGKIKYDVDNDGDGVTDSVWLDLGYPVQRNASGQTFKPLFAFMVIGLNGRMPLNTVGNIQSRDFQLRTKAGDPLPFPNNPGPVQANFTSENYRDGATWRHASHLGFSVNEINPCYALQNAPNTVHGTTLVPPSYSQFDFSNFVGYDPDAIQSGLNGINVSTTQLRNILAGTIPQVVKTGPLPTTAPSGNDRNTVRVNNQYWYLPNGVIDNEDVTSPSGSVDRNGVAAVPGRWGETQGIPTVLTVPPAVGEEPPGTGVRTTPGYYNPVRAGRSVRNPIVPAGTPTWLTADSMDDDYDAFDFFPFPPAPGYVPSNAEGTFNAGPPPIGFGDYYDENGSLQQVVERLRRYRTPIDPAGVGRVVAWNERPYNAWDYGTGFDKRGRVNHFRYFRPAGVPKAIVYDAQPPASEGLTTFQVAEVFKQPIARGPAVGDRSNNLLNGYVASLFPLGGVGYGVTPLPGTLDPTKAAAGVAVSAAMPLDMNGGTLFGSAYVAPTINPPTPLTATTMSTLVNTSQGPLLPAGDPDQPTANYLIPPAPYGGVINGLPTYPAYDVTTNPPTPLPSSSLNKDEADEMNLYAANIYDAPFGPSDLEWLYRKQDVDGASLDSRLRRLAPISFDNGADDLTRRRLFSTDTWETITYSHATDNPQGAFPWNSRLDQTSNGLPTTFRPAFPEVSLDARNYNADPNGSPSYLPFSLNRFGRNNQPLDPFSNFPNSLAHFPDPVAFGPGQMPTAYPNYPTGPLVPNNQYAPVVTPSVAHRGRKINLNYPLPVANAPDEPVRQKWVRETYQLFKAALPPQAVDSPQELAQLSQFVVNIVDFRDPDCTTTRFVNTDVMNVQPAPGSLDPPHLEFSNVPVPGLLPATGQVFYPYDPKIYDEQKPWPLNTRTAAWRNATDQATPTPARGDFLVQHGMEYSPLAINEAVAYRYQAKIGGGPQPYTKLALELVNTLTGDGVTTPSRLSDLGSVELDGWQIVLTADNPATASTPAMPATTPEPPFAVPGRPDPTTGDVPPNALIDAMGNGRIAVVRDNGVTDPGRPVQGTTSPAAPDPLTFRLGTTATPVAPINAMDKDGPQGARAYYVIANNTLAGTPPFPTLTSNPPSRSNGINESVVPFLNDADLPGNFRVPFPSGPSGTRWHWLYLRRPANPFDLSPYKNREMVVVDSIRFPMVDLTGVGTAGSTGPPPTEDTATNTGARQLTYSAQRRQPYRGGHFVPRLTGSAVPSPSYAWGYSEQTSPSTAAITAYFGASQRATGGNQELARLHHTIGRENNPIDPSWDLVPFHDRDFQGVAELLLVPGCPPGLFTKQFVEENYDPVNGRAPATGFTDATAIAAIPPATGPNVGVPFNAAEPRTYPYLSDRFFYTAASVAPLTNPPTAAIPYPTKVGTWTGDGWFKLLEFVEVPSSANGAIGPVGAGANFDWARQDVKPGLLNLNLIIDEEVFFGLLDDHRLNSRLAIPDTALNGGNSPLPRIVSEIDANGYPAYDTVTNGFAYTGAYPIASPGTLTNSPYFGTNNAFGRGYTYFDPVTGETHGMKSAFSDFLKLRAGGSGFLFAWGSGQVSSGNFYPFPTVPDTSATGPVRNRTILKPVASERPFRSLSYPDINYTVMRPANLPPSPDNSATYPGLPGTNPPATFMPPFLPLLLPNTYPYPNDTGDYQATPVPLPPVPFVGDPGVRNPFIDPNPFPTTPPARRIVPTIPLRRLFQVPDVQNVASGTRTPSASAEFGFTGGDFATPGTPPASYASNVPTNLPIEHENLSTNGGLGGTGHSANLFSAFETIYVPGTAIQQQVNHYLGAGLTGGNDQRQHPQYRTEMLQKVMNLTTVRTHQFAVWITVGFFEVLDAGTPALGTPDRLGAELGQLAGKNIRYRSFFLLDRTKAVGFNPSSPVDFRDVVTYRRRIE